MNKEIWKSIPNYPNYKVSNLGNVKNVKTERILKPGNSNGYLQIGLSNKGQREHFYIYRIVAEAFKKNKKEVITHLDGNLKNNCSKNLKYITYGELYKKVSKRQTGRVRIELQGENHKLAKLTNKQVKDIKTKYLHTSETILKKKYNISGTTISYIKNNKTWKHI